MKRTTFRDGVGAPEYYMLGGRDPMRLLTRSEVTFERTTEPDTSSWQGSSDDPELEAEIAERLANDDASAWCGVIVTAKWTGARGAYQGRASLWGCTLNDRYTDADCAKDHDLEGEALADLNEWLATMIETAQLLLAELHPNAPKSPQGTRIRRVTRSKAKS
jgi:hypothetical protein